MSRVRRGAGRRHRCADNLALTSTNAINTTLAGSRQHPQKEIAMTPRKNSIDNFAVLNSDGSYTLSPAAVLLLSGDCLYDDPDETTPAGQQAAQRYLDGFMAASRAGGFLQADLLLTRIARREGGPKIIALAQQAERAAGTQRLRELFLELGL